MKLTERFNWFEKGFVDGVNKKVTIHLLTPTCRGFYEEGIKVGAAALSKAIREYAKEVEKEVPLTKFTRKKPAL